jgi:DNA-binding response OmpR family regulator
MKSPFVPIWTIMRREPVAGGQESAVLPRLPAETSRPKRSALVVDDDTDIPPLVELALSRYDFATEGVRDGAAALARLRSQVYDLVILDLGMAELDGFDVLHAMKRERRLREIPVIVLTADSSEQALARSFGYGADDFVTKPFKPNELGMRAYRLV